jgi:hypothetical protein
MVVPLQMSDLRARRQHTFGLRFPVGFFALRGNRFVLESMDPGCKVVPESDRVLTAWTSGAGGVTWRHIVI